MERFFDALGLFIRYQLRADDWVSYLVFVVVSGFVGLSIVLLDLCSVVLEQNSFLGLTHGRKATPKAALVWMLGAMLGGFLGLLSRVFEPTPLAAVLVSLTWRTLLAKLKDLSVHPVQQPGKE